MALTYGTSTALTITAGSLASNAARSSAAVTTSSENVAGILLSVNILTTASAATGNKQFIVYGYMSENGTNYRGNSGTTDNVDGTDKALTAVGSPTNLVQIGTIAANQGAVAVTLRGVFEVTAALGGVFPKWGIVLHNDQGVAAGATVTATYREYWFT